MAAVLSGLKLLGVITWSWWFVLTPLWLPPLLFSLTVFVTAAAFEAWQEARKEYFNSRYSLNTDKLLDDIFNSKKEEGHRTAGE